jgi:hypothetical protein
VVVSQATPSLTGERVWLASKTKDGEGIYHDTPPEKGVSMQRVWPASETKDGDRDEGCG